MNGTIIIQIVPLDGLRKRLPGGNKMRNLIKGLEDNEIQVIGLEFTVRTYQRGVQELAMFSPQGLIIPRIRSNYPGGDRYVPKITFHTTDGDFNLEDYNGACPW